MHVAIDVGRYLGSTGDFLAGITQFSDSFVDFLFKREAEVADVLVFELFVLSRKRRALKEVGFCVQHVLTAPSRFERARSTFSVMA